MPSSNCTVTATEYEVEETKLDIERTLDAHCSVIESRRNQVQWIPDSNAE